MAWNVTATSHATEYLLESAHHISFIEIAVIIPALLLAYIVLTNIRHYNPTGKFTVPLLGHTLWFISADNPFKDIYELSDRCGEIVTLNWIGGKKWVILNSPEAIQEGYVKNSDALSEKCPHTGSLLGIEGPGLAEPDGRWQMLRRHMITAFRDRGIGKQGFEPVILDEISHFLGVLEESCGQPFDPSDLLRMAMSNIIMSAIFSERLDYSDDKLDTIQFNKFASLNLSAQVLPLLKYLPVDLMGYDKAKQKATRGIQLCMAQISQHKRDIEHDNPPRDYVDSFLMKMNEDKDNPQSVFNDANLMVNVTGSYLGGTDTTSETLYWAFLFMIVYPDVQQKIYAEINAVIGERVPSYTDRQNLPFTMSVSTEIMRIGTVSNGTMGVPASRDITILGTRVAQGTMVSANLHSTLFNTTAYKDPWLFQPDRFLDENGKFEKPSRLAFSPFGIGRRSCIGEPLARTEYFLFLICTLQKYKLVQGQTNVPSTKPVRKFILSPEKNYQIMVTPRL